MVLAVKAEVVPVIRLVVGISMGGKLVDSFDILVANEENLRENFIADRILALVFYLVVFIYLDLEIVVGIVIYWQQKLGVFLTRVEVDLRKVSEEPLRVI